MEFRKFIKVNNEFTLRADFYVERVACWYRTLLWLAKEWAWCLQEAAPTIQK